MHWLVRSLLNLVWPLLICLSNIWPLSWLKGSLSRNLRKPDDNLVAGYFMSKLLESSNDKEEQLAVEKCDIQPTDQVLEVGFGPGLGLELAVAFLDKSRKGKLFGVDFSQSMVNAASNRMKQYIQDGLVQLHHESVAKLPFDDQTFDKIYHCNVYYFWDDCVGCCSELLRVLKPGGTMITTIDLKSVLAATNMGLVSNTDVDSYMVSLQTAGFVDVNMKEFQRSGVTLGCVYARVKQ